MKQKQFLAALHVHSREQVIREVKKILTPRGAHGVILVNNGLYVSSDKDVYPNLFDITTAVKETYPGYIVGINPLDLGIAKALDRCLYEKASYMTVWGQDTIPFDLLWHDDCGIQEKDGSIVVDNEFSHFADEAKRFGPPMLRYGSVAFKYKKQPNNLQAVIEEAAKYFSALITSGAGTGIAADIEKIKRIKSFVGDIPLGIASGVTAENAAQYAPYVDIFIVGTSLFEDPTNDSVYSKSAIEELRRVVEVL